MSFQGQQPAYVKGNFCGAGTYVVIKPHPLQGEQYLNAKGEWDIVDNAEIFSCPNKAVEASRKAENKRSDVSVTRKPRK